MNEGTTFVGMDAHKASIQVALLRPGEQRPVEWQVENNAKAVGRLAQRLKRESGGDVVACYEAGPTGYALMRQLVGLGVVCKVIAPSLIPKRSGDRVKTDRRDARKLASMFRAGLLTEVRPPTPEQEAVRDLCRARNDAREDRVRARHRLGKFLLRHGVTYPGKAWTLAHHRWLRTLRFEHEAAQATFDDYLRTVDAADDRIKSLDEQIEAQAKTPAYADAVGVLCSFHGIKVLTAMVLLSELGDVTRFASPRQLMAYLGVTPSERSSGGRSKRGGITKAGNSHLRRVLIEASWHYRHRPRVSAQLRRRRQGQPEWAIAIADRAHSRLYRRRYRLESLGKKSPVATVAVARELVGFIWNALMTLERRRAAG